VLLARKVASVSETVDPILLRAMTAADVPRRARRPGAGRDSRSLAAVFPQVTYPFPRDEVAQRWTDEIATPGIECLLVLGGSAVIEFAAIRDDEFSHFGKWLLDPRTGQVVFWTSDTGIDGENPVEMDELDLIPIDPIRRTSGFRTWPTC